MSTVIDQPPTDQSLAVPEKGTPLPVFTGQEMTAALTAYRDLQKALDQAMPDQIMDLDGKPFRKKGYWRAIAVAFNLTVEPTDERREVQGFFDDGRENFGYVLTYRATAPNGRSEPGDGACFAVEKARRRGEANPWASLPHQATEHNVRSHAHTRAFNRAVSNLVGFGEVSAEEVEREERSDALPLARPAPATRAPAPPPAPPRTGHGSSAPVISEAQAKRFYAIAKSAGWDDADLRNWLQTEYGLASDRDIPRRQYDDICAQVQQGGGR